MRALAEFVSRSGSTKDDLRWKPAFPHPLFSCHLVVEPPYCAFTPISHLVLPLAIDATAFTLLRVPLNPPDVEGEEEEEPPSSGTLIPSPTKTLSEDVDGGEA